MLPNTELLTEATSTRIRIFLKTLLFYPFKKRSASTQGAFSKISPSTRKCCDIRKWPMSAMSMRRLTKCPRVIAWSPMIRAHALIGGKSTLWRRFRKAPFSAVHTTTEKRCFQKYPLWRAFSKSFVFGDRKRRLRVDVNPKRIKKDAFSKISGYVWTGP